MMPRIELSGILTKVNSAQLFGRILALESRYGRQSHAYPVTRIFCGRHYSKDDKPSNQDDNKDEPVSKTEKEHPSQPAKKKLDDLLQSIIKDSAQIKTSSKKIDMNLAGYSKKVNMEKHKEAEPSNQEDGKPVEKEQNLNPELVKAVKSVAQALGGDAAITESELVQKLKTQSKINMSELFVGMKIDRTKEKDSVADPRPSVEGRGQYVRQQMRDQPDRWAKFKGSQRQTSGMVGQRGEHYRQRQQQQEQYQSVGIFQSKPLGIFSAQPKTQLQEGPTLKTWDMLAEKELKLSVTHPPTNGFEEMILWTETGKLWKFPINNEQDYGDEANVDFQDHVFLEPQLDPWCPKRGPIRHFMEVVCTALGKNSYLTAKEKRENIDWYRNYFKEKAAIVKETGAGVIQ